MSDAPTSPASMGDGASGFADAELDALSARLVVCVSPVVLFYGGLLAFHYGQRAMGAFFGALFVALHLGLVAFRRGRLSATRLGLVTVWVAVGAGCWARGGVTVAAINWHAFAVIAAWIAQRPRLAAAYAWLAGLQLSALALLDAFNVLGEQPPATLFSVQVTAASSFLALVWLVALQRQRVLRVQETTERLRQRVLRLNEIAGAARLGGRVAHEVNNVLAVVGAHAEGLGAELPADSPLQRDVQAIRRSVAAGAGLTRRLLASARVEPVRGRSPLDFAPLLSGLVQRAAQDLPAGVTLRTELREEALRVEGDAWELEQLAEALVLNAQAALGEKGTLVVRSHLRHEPAARELCYGTLAPGDYVVLEVADDGVGIAAEVLPRLAQPFFSERQEVDSAGLGLALVHGVASAMGGQLDARSGLGKGSTFTVYLPALPATAAVHRLSCRRGVSARSGSCSSRTTYWSARPWRGCSAWMVTTSCTPAPAPRPCAGPRSISAAATRSLRTS
ncbi:MAG: ATP-binding protein [Myxococcota bacterium]